MEKYMKFPMYEKETKDKKYRDDPFGDCPDKLRFYLHKYHLSKLAKANPVKAAGWIPSKKYRRKTNFLRLWLVYTFLREKLSTALMGKKKQTLFILGKSLRFPFGVI